MDPTNAIATAVLAALTVGLGLGPTVPSATVPPSSISAAPAAQASSGRWVWPLTPRPSIVRPFVAPASTWGAGHRGLDLLGLPGRPVHAVEGGVVGHVGVIAGRGTVTVVHADGLRSTYEPLVPTVRSGQEVVTGDLIGTLTSTGSHCAPATCLHLGAKRADGYLDPGPLLVRPRIILKPVRGPG